MMNNIEAYNKLYKEFTPYKFKVTDDQRKITKAALIVFDKWLEAYEKRHFGNDTSSKLWEQLDENKSLFNQSTASETQEPTIVKKKYTDEEVLLFVMQIWCSCLLNVQMPTVYNSKQNRGIARKTANNFVKGCYVTKAAVEKINDAIRKVKLLNMN